MIVGTVVIEDNVINFKFVGQVVEVTVIDTLTGASDTYCCPQDCFAAALSIAVDPNGEATEDKYSLAEQAMPSDHKLRWIA